jgi:hypothetical protein
MQQFIGHCADEQAGHHWAQWPTARRLLVDLKLVDHPRASDALCFYLPRVNEGKGALP